MVLTPELLSLKQGEKMRTYLDAFDDRIRALESGDPQSALGWADYADSTYTSGSPLAVTADTDTLLPNDGVNGVKTYEPAGVTLYNTANNTIFGRQGDAKLITVNFTVQRASGSGAYDFDVWFDIGGSIGELYRRYSTLRGTGAQSYTTTTGVYTLDTWEANGATVNVRASVNVEIYDIRFVIIRLYPAPAA